MLQLENMHCGYGQMKAVQGLDLIAEPGKITALLGANGAGKSSTMMCIAGHVELQGGTIQYKGVDISNHTPMQRVSSGIGVVPEGRRLFADLTVEENLIMGGYCRSKKKTGPNMERVYEIFPRVKERRGQRAGALSGGEQQMVAIGRALMSEPELLLVDELSLGLMPKAIDICYQALSELKDLGLAIVLVEQSTQRAIEVADDITVLESGRVVWAGTAEESRNSMDVIDACLGLKSSD
jgi:branched-chain amino acid transport system ATP-binding protein